MPDERPLLGGGERLIREIDRPPSGFGTKFHPFTVDEAKTALSPLVSAMSASIQSMDERLRAERVIFQATLLPNYLAASYFPADLIRALDLVPLGARRSTAPHRTAKSETPDVETRSLVLAGTDDAVAKLSLLLSVGARTKTEQKAEETLNRFIDFRLATRDEVVKGAVDDDSPSGSDLTVFEAVLHPDPDESRSTLLPLSDANFQKWVNYVARLGGRVSSEYRRHLGGLTFVPVHMPAGASPDAVAFNLLRALRPMPVVRPLPGTFLRSAAPRLNPPANQAPLTDLRVAVFDSGIDQQSEIFSTVTEIAAATGATDPGLVTHGSAVTAAVLYGNVEEGAALPQPATSLTHVRIFPPDVADMDGYWMLDQITEFVQNHDVDVVHLSIGPDAPVEDDAEPHRWTVTLDELAYEHGVLFVTATGNHGTRPPDFNRVASPADMINGLSVGACDSHAPQNPWKRAAYSQVGPGRHGARLQPSGVQFGGVDGNEFLGLRGDGSLWATMGTSFAAPLATNGLCRLAARLAPERLTQNNLRAFAIHFAERHGEQTTHELGHGRLLASYDDAFECPTNEVHVHFQGTLRRDQLVSVPIPLPTTVTTGKVQLAGTLVFTAPVEPTQPLEYSQASIDMTFRPHASRFRLSMEGAKSHIVDAVDDSAKFADLVGQGYVPSAEPVSRAPRGLVGNDELALREGGKWETVRVFEDSLLATSLDRPRIDLTFLSRQAGLLTHAGDTLDYTLLLTIRTPGHLKLYEETRTEFGVLSPLAVRPRLSLAT